MEISSLFSNKKTRPHKHKYLRRNLKRAYQFIALLGVIGFFLLGRFFYLGVFQHHKFAQLADRNKNRIFWEKAKRGIIYDRNKTQLVYNKPGFKLVVSTQKLPQKEAQRRSIAEKLTEVVDKEVGKLLQKFKEGEKLYYQSLVLKKDLERQEAIRLKSKFSDVNSVEIIETTKRFYPEGKYLSHILGYTSEPTEKEVQTREEILTIDEVGRMGVEKSYDKFLQGKPGKEVIEVNSLGKKIRTIETRDSKSGNNVVLTIDLKLQKSLYDNMREVLKKGGLEKGAAVALDPKTGAILGMVSFPSYDNNEFSKKYTKLSQDPNHPLVNRAIKGTYPPGSCFKPVLALGALNENLIDPAKKINCKGRISLSGRYGSAVFKDWRRHGLTDMKKAIAQSCNVYFYTLGGGYEGQSGLGIEKISEYAQKLGLGHKTGIDLSDEASGRIPTPEWKKNRFGKRWYKGDTYNTSIGQGYVKVTPLQIAVMTSYFANKDHPIKPHLLDKILGAEEKTIKEYANPSVDNIKIKTDKIETVREGMREMVLSGTAEYLKYAPVEVAGKTGTAQFGSEGKAHGWLTSFAPYENPEIVLSVVIEAGADKGGLPAIFTRRVYDEYFKEG